MPKTSAGLLLYRRRPTGVEVLLAHPGGPFWASKDDGAWSLPKGEYLPGDDPLRAAKREFEEELGFPVTASHVTPLTPRTQPGGKVVSAWAVEEDCDTADVRSNTFSMEWPPRSGRRQEFPEVDRAGWFPLADAHRKINAGQRGFLEELEVILTS